MATIEERLFSVDAKYVANLIEQLRQARKGMRRLKAHLVAKDETIATYEKALKGIVAHADVTGLWNQEQILAEAALDEVFDKKTAPKKV